MEKKETKIICFANNKNRCGKTTTVAAVGQTWADCKFKVLLVDLDAQATLTSMITGTDPAKKEWERTIENALIERKGLPIAEISEYMHIVPADMELSNFERVTSYMQGREFLLSDLLESVKGEYDYCIIDTPPSLGVASVNALVSADWCIVVATADIYSIQGIGQLKNTIDAIKTYCNPSLEVKGLLITKFKQNQILSQSVADELEEIAKVLSTKVFKTKIRESVAIGESALKRLNMFEYKPKCNACVDYMEFIKELEEFSNSERSLERLLQDSLVNFLLRLE